MNQNTSRSPDLPQPLRAVASGLRHLPGAEQVGRVAGGALDTIGAVSPRGRRMAVYTGAGVLGAVGVVEWPVALTGAAVAWLTQPRPGPRPEGTKSSDGGTPDAAEGRQDARTEPGTEPEPAAEPSADRGPGDRLASSRHRHEPAEQHTHEQPAKVGDTATASALKQVAEATTHHGPPGAHGQPHDDRHTG
ncbi:hypothetical protein [Streptomyces sp.]|uniref:hypothetical protein n=1 Tax=Streptomyces sp. TaxID=1931 RepID=UPI00281285C5|nr:hypothetical protein [Streptomyces sp.]